MTRVVGWQERLKGRGIMTRLKVLQDIGKRANFTVDRYSPGDGKVRFRFFTGTIPKDYFSGSGDYTALGWREALSYATGRFHGATNG